MKPLVHIGWVLAADTRSENVVQANQAARERLQEMLEQQFHQFTWKVQFLQRHRYAPRGAIDPLPLLEHGVREKTLHRWDYALVVVTNALQARDLVETIGIPSSALETAVLSSAEMGDGPEMADRLLGLALHLLGHLWGLEHQESGPMHPPDTPKELTAVPFPETQQTIIVDRLEEVADRRLEEQQKRWRLPSFYWRSFWADPKSILIDVIGYAPWTLPIQMGRLSAATAASMVVLLLTAEAWEVGVNLTASGLMIGAVFVILTASLFLFYGQNLGQISRRMEWREQIARTRIIIFGTLLLGMSALWLTLLAFTFILVQIFPPAVLAKWTGSSVGWELLLQQAIFMADVGVLAGALGGNLEDEREIKSRLFYDEET